MKLGGKIGKINTKDIVGLVMAIGAGVVAFSGSLADRKHAQEFEQMKKDIVELQKQLKGGD